MSFHRKSEQYVITAICLFIRTQTDRPMIEFVTPMEGVIVKSTFGKELTSIGKNAKGYYVFNYGKDMLKLTDSQQLT